mmetsp:Transcript_27947/g.83757  ORF Transcript_27947/g.83757 Transcript_27947/m.83757 type:complete len:216 (-) Transcript_27947:30-677(-)
MSEYAKVKRGGGKLKLKGGGMKKKRKAADGLPRPPKAAPAPGDAAAEEEEEDFTVENGSGRISSSGTTVRGHEGTKFMTELAPGDAVIITHPTTLIEETRIVRMVLSDVSIAISSPFSTDLISTCTFRYIAAPRKEQSADERNAQRRAQAVAREDGAVGDYAGGGGTTLVYRTRKKGAVGGSNGWHIVTEQLSEAKTRTELLEMRSKYKSDRHCG